LSALLENQIFLQFHLCRSTFSPLSLQRWSARSWGWLELIPVHLCRHGRSVLIAVDRDPYNPRLSASLADPELVQPATRHSTTESSSWLTPSLPVASCHAIVISLALTPVQPVEAAPWSTLCVPVSHAGTQLDFCAKLPCPAWVFRSSRFHVHLLDTCPVGWWTSRCRTKVSLAR
jgi:hypothetical protein